MDGVDSTGNGRRLGRQDLNSQKDVALVVENLFGEKTASSLSGLFYYGHTPLGRGGNVTFYRLGVFGAWAVNNAQNFEDVRLSGGVGGIVVANALWHKLPHQHRVVVVEKNAEHHFAPSFLWLMTGDRSADRITKPVQTLLRSGVEVIHGEITRIDISNRQITTTAQTLTYDYLIIALGAELAPELIPGLAEGA